MLMSSGEEMQLGLSSFNQLKKDTPVSKNAVANAMLQRVGQRISAVAELPNAQWEFVLFESKEANAFCLPGGKVGIYTGILEITKDEAGLATVIGHEVAHAVARHGAERVSEAMLMKAGGHLLGAGISSADPRTQALTMAAYGIGAQLGRELPHSPGQESEDLLDKVALGAVDVVIADSDIVSVSHNFHPELAVAFNLTEKQPLAWVFPKDVDPFLYEKAQDFFARIQKDGTLKRLLDRYYGHVKRLERRRHRGDR